MTLKEDLERMEKEDREATPGPWKRGEEHETMAQVTSPHRLNPIGTVRLASGSLFGVNESECEANFSLITSARTDRPALVELVKLYRIAYRNLWLGEPPTDANPVFMEERLWIEAKKKASSK